MRISCTRLASGSRTQWRRWWSADMTTGAIRAAQVQDADVETGAALVVHDQYAAGFSRGREHTQKIAIEFLDRDRPRLRSRSVLRHARRHFTALTAEQKALAVGRIRSTSGGHSETPWIAEPFADEPVHVDHRGVDASDRGSRRMRSCVGPSSAIRRLRSCGDRGNRGGLSFRACRRRRSAAHVRQRWRPSAPPENASFGSAGSSNTSDRVRASRGRPRGPSCGGACRPRRREVPGDDPRAAFV
jgi:hypothetical protein